MCTVLEVIMFTVFGVIALTILEVAVLLGTGKTSTVVIARSYDTIAGGVLPPSHMVVSLCTEK